MLIEKAHLAIYDPQVSLEQIIRDLENVGITDAVELAESGAIKKVSSPQEAADAAHAVAILTEWDEFRTLAYEKIYDSMLKPACLFDGRNIVDRGALRNIGFDVYSIGKGDSRGTEWEVR